MAGPDLYPNLPSSGSRPPLLRTGSLHWVCRRSVVLSRLWLDMTNCDCETRGQTSAVSPLHYTKDFIAMKKTMKPYFTPVLNDTADGTVYKNVLIEYYGDNGGVMQIRSDENATSRSGLIKLPGNGRLVAIRWVVDSPDMRTIHFEYIG